MEPQNNSGMSKLMAGFLELFFLIVLVSMILLTFNYFNIIPLYLTSPIFSFLPHQQLPASTQQIRQEAISGLSPTPFQFAGNQVKKLITTSEVKTFQNKEKTANYIPIPESTIDINGKINIDIEMFIKNNGTLETKTTNGYLFSNDKTGTPEWRALNILYFSEFNTWTLQYNHGEQSEYYSLDTVYTNPAYGKFTLTILDDGKRVIVTEPDMKDKVFDLPDSLYSESKKFNSVIMVSPEFEVQILSLTYYY